MINKYLLRMIDIALAIRLQPIEERLNDISDQLDHLTNTQEEPLDKRIEAMEKEAAF